MIQFDHMSLPVADPKASRDWYTATFGFKVEFEIPERRTIAIQDGAGFTIFLYPAGGDLAGVRPAFTFQVENVDAKFAELTQRGIEFVEPPGKHYWGYGAELYDPDGYRLLIWDKASMERSTEEEASAENRG